MEERRDQLVEVPLKRWYVNWSLNELWGQLWGQRTIDRGAMGAKAPARSKLEIHQVRNAWNRAVEPGYGCNWSATRSFKGQVSQDLGLLHGYTMSFFKLEDIFVLHTCSTSISIFRWCWKAMFPYTSWVRNGAPNQPCVAQRRHVIKLI